jgi:hypothetical protein
MKVIVKLEKWHNQYLKNVNVLNVDLGHKYLNLM